MEGNFSIFSVVNTLGLAQCFVMREEWEREIKTFFEKTQELVSQVLTQNVNLSCCYCSDRKMQIFIWGEV